MSALTTKPLIFLEFSCLPGDRLVWMEAGQIESIRIGWICQGEHRYTVFLTSGKSIDILENSDEVRTILREAGIL